MKKLVVGINDLASKHPELIPEWSERNKPLLPTQVSFGSGRKVWWAGKCGHEWQASVKNRVNGHGCPYCSGNAVKPDFNSLLLIHPGLQSEWSERNGQLSPAHFAPHSNRKVWWRCRNGHEWEARIADRTDGHGCPFCTGQRILAGYNDLRGTHPELAAEWSDRNDTGPEGITARSDKYAWWKCSACGYEWKALVRTRAKGSPCPVCSSRIVVSGINDLATTDPGIAREWYPEANGEPRPEHISRYSLKKVWWRSSVCGHTWRARIADRTLREQGCVICRDEVRCIFPQLMCGFYMGRAGQRVVFDDEDLTGLPLDVYLPDQGAVFLFSLKTFYSVREERWETLRHHMCEANGLRVIRLMKDTIPPLAADRIVRIRENDREQVASGIREMLRLTGVYTEVCTEKDMDDVYRLGMKLVSGEKQ